LSHFILEILPALVMLGLVPAVVAYAKDRSFFLWWFYGTALLPIALLHSLLLRRGAPTEGEADYPPPKTMPPVE
jgi:hypothetical protein